MRLEIVRRVAEWYVCRELALQAEVKRPRKPITATRSVALVRPFLLGLADSSIVRIKVELVRKVLGESSGRTHAQVVAQQVVSIQHTTDDQIDRKTTHV